MKEGQKTLPTFIHLPLNKTKPEKKTKTVKIKGDRERSNVKPHLKKKKRVNLICKSKLFPGLITSILPTLHYLFLPN